LEFRILEEESKIVVARITEHLQSENKIVDFKLPSEAPTFVFKHIAERLDITD